MKSLIYLLPVFLVAPLLLTNCERDEDVTQLAQDIRSEFDHTLRSPGYTGGWLRLTIEPEEAFDNDEEQARKIAKFAFENWQGEPAEGVVIVMETATGTGTMDAATRDEFEFSADELQ